MPPVLPTPEEIILKIQTEVYPRRMRINELFRDFDGLRKGQVQQSQFIRALDQIMKGARRLEPAEVDVLIKTFMKENGFVQYKDFCDKVEEVFVTKNLHTIPRAAVKPSGSQLSASQLPALDDEMEAILYRVALLLRTRGLVMKYVFEDMDRGDSAALTVPRRGGKVSESNFKRAWPFGTQDFSTYEIDRICARYRDVNGNIDYRALHEEVTDPADTILDAPIPTSIYIPPAESTKRAWSSANYSILERITAKVIEKRVRLLEYFQDLDHLRKGFVRAAQVDTVFGIVNLKFTTAEMSELKAMYEKQDLNFTLFNYAAFCKDVQSAFAYDQIHTDPLARVELPTADATLPSRRSRITLTDEEKQAVAEIEEDVRSRVAKRRVLFKNAFSDFDKGGEGHVTRNQFARVMSTLNLMSHDERMLDLLCLRYCDKGNPNIFNYREFSENCDPRSAELAKAEAENLAPYQKKQPSKYFNTSGQVYDHFEATGTVKAA